ncbi:hypothetical protein [Flavobacterium sp. HSC-61S13]|uniref:hypothetical protein n=1 Tax=Flavobacterium sp. HSC-61S13 TaxID=2910963 RepID=UPI00209E4EB2|nr:hypothetical protein [Flavobacterium sp. HSC-61S13]MCP1996173.1 hypothetical protein [Flavobacterium sp. HSC-61S13]
MKKSKRKVLDSLIKEGDKLNFDNNRRPGTDLNGHLIYYSDASIELNSWVSKVEHFIRLNYNNDSGPLKAFKLVDQTKFSGNYRESFNKELAKLKGAINSCQEIEPNKEGVKNDIINLISSKLFWFVILSISTTVGTIAYKMGESNGKEMNYIKDKQLDQLKDSINILNRKKAG